VGRNSGDKNVSNQETINILVLNRTGSSQKEISKLTDRSEPTIKKQRANH